MVHTNVSAWSNLQSILRHHQLPAVPAYNFSVLPATHPTHFSAHHCSYSLYTVWICHWNQGSGYVFPRWILRYILPFNSDRFYYWRCHRSYQLHIVGRFIPSMVLLCYIRHSSIHISTSQLGLAVQYFIPRCIPPCHLSHPNPVGAPQPWTGEPLFCARLFIQVPRCSAWMGAAQCEWALRHRIGAAQSPLALLRLNSCPLFHSALFHHFLDYPCPSSTLPILALLFSWLRTCVSHKIIIIAIQTPFRLTAR